MKVLSRGSLVILVSLILLSAHAPDEPIYGYLWRTLAWAGLDIPMTPLTSDMALMLDPATKRQSYRESFQLLIDTGQSQPTVMSIGEADFYLIRLPGLLIAELAAYGSDVEGPVSAVCRSLTYQLKKPILSWKLVSQTPVGTQIPEELLKMGLGFDCPGIVTGS